MQCRKEKNAELILYNAGIKVNLKRIKIFHNDCGSGFNNHVIDEALHTFGIKWSLSRIANLYNN